MYTLKLCYWNGIVFKYYWLYELHKNDITACTIKFNDKDTR